MELGTGLIFVRHAQSIGNVMTQDERAEHPIANRDYPLTDLGRRQAILTGVWLRETHSINLLEPHFCSTFKRTEETLRLILKALGRERDRVIVDPRLDEKWDGIFHELAKSRIQSEYPQEIEKRKKQGYYHYRAPNGQNCPDVEERIASFAAEYLAPQRMGLRLVVGHGRWFIIFQKMLHALSVEQFLELKSADRQRNCAVTLYSRSRGDTLPLPTVPWEGKLEDIESEHA